MRIISILLSFLLTILPSSLCSFDFTAGVVNSYDSLPVEGVLATFINTNTGEKYTSTSGANGQYEFQNLPNGNYILTLEKNGFILEKYEYPNSSKNISNVVSYFAPSTWGYNVSGEIIDSSTGIGIENATVKLQLDQTTIDTYTTNVEGEYNTAFLNNTGSYTLQASASNYITNSISFDLTDSHLVNENIYLTPFDGSISGTVTASVGGAPIEGALIKVEQYGELFGSATTNAAGYYSISGLAETSYNIIVTAEGYQTFLDGSLAQTGTDTTFNPELTLSGGSIAGIITDKSTGKALEGIQVTLQLNGVNILTTTTDSSGQYGFANLSSDLYVIHASGDNHEVGYAKAKIIDVTPTTIDFALGSNPGSARGTITNNSQPLAGAKVNILQNNILLGTILTQSNGAYSFTGLAPGSYSIFALETDYQIQQAVVSITANQISTQKFDLIKGSGKASGTVTISGGGSPSGAHITIYQNNTLFGAVITDKNGNYLLESLPPGTYDIYAQKNPYQFASNTVTITQGSTTENIDFTLSPGPSTVEGTITEEGTGLVLDGATVEILSNGTHLFNFLPTTSNGEYILRGLSPGSYKVQAKKTGFITKTSALFTISSTGEVTVTEDLALITQNPPTNDLRGIAYSNRSLLAEDRIHRITWGATTSEGVVGFRVYRNGKLVQEYNLSDERLYESHNNPVDGSTIYTVVSINSDGSQSIGASVTLNSRSPRWNPPS
ncbi:carboxypeptidase regulatory-like domain-containing protein [bacterium]|nr:carboxypeptidase regulatory-like domain-containing protein [bacterium]